MEVKASLKNLSISEKKLSAVLPLVRKKSVIEAIEIVKNIDRKAAKFVYKILRDVVSNAVNNHKLDEGSLYIKQIWATEGKKGRGSYRVVPGGGRGKRKFFRRYKANLFIIVEYVA